MKPIRIYLDICCLNRSLDDQSQLTVQLETQAIWFILQRIYNKECELVWSYYIDFENENNPHDSKKEAVAGLRNHASLIVKPTDEIEQTAVLLQSKGLRPIDASHVACAIHTQCQYFITVDRKIINKPIKNIMVINPVSFVQIYEEISKP